MTAALLQIVAVPSRVSLLSSLPCVQCKFKIYIILFSSTLPAAISGILTSTNTPHYAQIIRMQQYLTSSSSLVTFIHPTNNNSTPCNCQLIRRVVRSQAEWGQEQGQQENGLGLGLTSTLLSEKADYSEEEKAKPKRKLKTSVTCDRHCTVQTKGTATHFIPPFSL